MLTPPPPTPPPVNAGDIIKCVVGAGAVPLLSLLIQAGLDVNFNVGDDDEMVSGGVRGGMEEMGWDM